MFYPEDVMKNRWDLFITFILILTCVITPIRIAFYEQDDLQWTIINYTIDFMFLLDIVFTFNSAIYDDDFHIIQDRSILAKEYFRGWFLIDTLAIFPFTPIAEAS